VKNKAFFYANYEGLRQSLGQTFTNIVPSAEFRTEVLTQSPVLRPILDAYPLGQVPIDADTALLTKVASDTAKMPECSASIIGSMTRTRPLYVITSTMPTSISPKTQWEATTWCPMFLPTWFCNTSASYPPRPSTK
jgi:hypothetical protein